MKKIPLLLAIGLFLFACKPENTSQPITNPDSSPTPPADLSVDADGIMQTVQIVDTLTGNFSMGKKPVAALSSAISPNPIMKEDPVKPVPVAPKAETPQQERLVRVLVSNYWVVQGLVRIRDKEASRTNPGAWFKFRPDGSYDYGYLQNKIGTGAWSIDGQKATVHLDAPLVGDDREWKMQIAKTEDVMVWVGTERYNTTGINLKLLNLLFTPKNRKEIGLDYY
ncbi:MAG: hypothetical protein IPM82_26905 [Saprospiraceae bacterium]|nr:hypothetical protein [Saprospiraceae bacterium]